MTFHVLEGVEEYNKYEETEMESMVPDDRESESEGFSEVDTVSDVAPAASKHKGIFRRRPKRGSSDNSVEGLQGDGPFIEKSGSGSSAASSESLAPQPRAEHRLRKATRKATGNPSHPSPSYSSSFPPSTTSPTPTSSWRTNPFVRRPPPLNSLSFPPLHITDESESYIIPPRTPQSLVLPVSPERPRGLALFMATAFRKSHTQDHSALLASPPLSPQIPPPM